MDDSYLSKLYAHMIMKGVAFEDGLSDKEVVRIERKYQFVFPPDLREFIQWHLPVSKEFPNWRKGNKKDLLIKLEWPMDGIIFDIEHNRFWLKEWGEKLIY